MGCLDVPTPPLPTLPDPFSIPPLPAPGPVQVGLCCQSLEFAPDLPLPIIPPQSVALIQTLNAAIDAFEAYVDDLVPPCPRNSVKVTT